MIAHSQLGAMLDASLQAHAFSGVVSIRQQDLILYQRAAGYADRSLHLVDGRMVL